MFDAITCCVFNPLFPLMSLSEIVLLSVLFICCVGARQVLVPMFVHVCTFSVMEQVPWTFILHFDSPAPDFPATYTHGADRISDQKI